MAAVPLDDRWLVAPDPPVEGTFAAFWLVRDDDSPAWERMHARYELERAVK